MIADLYTVYRTELLKYCCMICGNVSDAEDLLQETFMKALSNLDLLEELGEKERRAWLYKVARNLFYNACRRRTVEQNNHIRVEAEADGGFSKVETAMILSLLPPDLSQIFIKRYFDGYTSKELSEEYGVGYLFSDFKKRGGYQRSIELSRIYSLYRQNYCGCIYSKREQEERAARGQVFGCAACANASLCEGTEDEL